VQTLSAGDGPAIDPGVGIANDKAQITALEIRASNGGSKFLLFDLP
jgi:hypothetical protein